MPTKFQEKGPHVPKTCPKIKWKEYTQNEENRLETDVERGCKQHACHDVRKHGLRLAVWIRCKRKEHARVSQTDY